MTNTIAQVSKNKASDLAIVTGVPLFTKPVHVGRPNLGSHAAFLNRMKDILDRRWLTNNGPMVQEFERRLQEYLDVRNVISVTNATVAFEIVIRALDLKGEVIIPSFTFVATAHALQWQEITPVFCDVESTGHHIDPDRIEELITPRTTGVIGVHLWGIPCKDNELDKIADRRGLTLLYDVAHAFGCTLGGRMIGNFGAAEVFSFHATKFFNSFEAGAIATNDDALAERLRLMRNFGFKGYDNVEHVGTNGKMTEAAAAMGLTNLDSLDDFLAANIQNYGLYQELLAGLPGCSVITHLRDEAKELPICSSGDRRQASRHRSRFNHSHPSRRKHFGAPLFLPGLPSHGAVSLAVSLQHLSTPKHRGTGTSRSCPAYRNGCASARNRGNRFYHQIGIEQCGKNAGPSFHNTWARTRERIQRPDEPSL